MIGGWYRKNVIVFGGNKIVVVVLVGIELCCLLLDVSVCNLLYWLGLVVLMVIGYISDVDLYVFYCWVFFRILGIMLLESDFKYFVI